MSKQNEIRQKITDQIIAALSSGNLPPWHKTWHGSSNMGTPTNIVSKKAYRGVNPLVLWLHQDRFGFQNKWYASFNQWKSSFPGCSVKKRPNDVKQGEWGCPIIYYSIVTKTVEDQYTGIEMEESFPILRTFTVFNIDQIDDPKGVLEKYRASQNANPLNPNFIDFTPAENLVAKLAPEIVYGGDRACYRPSNDTIYLPHKCDFENEKEYYAALFHELAHWTEPRCGNVSESYAYNELRAEITAAMVLNQLNIPGSSDMTNTYSYLNSWIQHLQNDNKYIFRASAAASKAVDYIFGQSSQDSETVNEETLVAC